MEKEFNEEDALKVIRQSIEETKDTFKEKGFIYLLMGWLGFLTAIVNFSLMQFTSYKDSEPIRWVLLLITLLPLMRMGKKLFNKDTLIQAATDRKPLDYLWTAFSWTLLVVIIRMDHIGLEVYPIIIIIFGSVAYATGGILNYRPLGYGGTACLFLAMCSNLVRVEYRMLFLAASVLISFIIPGHMLRARK